MSRRALALMTAMLSVLGAQTPAAAQQVTPCDQQGPSDRSRVSAAPKYGTAPPEVVSVPSKQDGAAIQIGLIRPKVPAGTRVPVIVEASPYFHALQSIDLGKCVPFLADNFVPQGYAVALVALRGTADSGGCFEFFGFKERADLDQAVTWLGTRPWSNGSVGIVGKSSDGASAWEVAAFGNRYLKTIVPVSGVPDVFDLLFGRGTPDWRGPGILSAVYFAQSIQYLQGRSPQHTIEVAACPDYAVAEAAGVYSFLTGDLDPFGYWEERRYVREILARYRGSVFFVHGLQDWNVNPGTQFPFINEVRRRGVPMKTMLGQWGHSFPDEVERPSLRSDFADVLLRWMDRWLKDKRLGLGSAVQVEDSQGRWRNEPRWPPPGRSETLWLGPSDRLAPKPTDEEGTALVAPDPAHLQDPIGGQGAGVGELPVDTQAVQRTCGQPVCAAFRTAPYRATHRISGIPRVQLNVIPQGLGGTLSIYLYSESSDDLRRIGWGQVDLRFPRGRGKPQTVSPGSPLALEFELQPLDAVIPAGERLVMMVSMGNAFNRVPSSPATPVTIELGGRSGALRLLHVSPKASQYFKPPG